MKLSKLIDYTIEARTSRRAAGLEREDTARLALQANWPTVVKDREVRPIR